MIVYKGILEKLADRGLTSYVLKKNNLLSGSVIDRLRKNRPITTETLDTVCRLCECQPEDIIRYVPEEGDK